MKNFLIILCVLTTICTVWANNYCDKPCISENDGNCAGKINNNGKCEIPHTGCTETQVSLRLDNASLIDQLNSIWKGETKFYPICVNPKTVYLNEAMKKLFVDEHNKRRNYIAGGNVQTLMSACRMGTMQWDDELAKLAALNNHKCKMAHDKCRNTDVYTSSGQNAARNFSINNYIELKLEEQIPLTVEGWYSEVRCTHPRHIIAYPKRVTNPMGHFGVMISENNVRVGCGVATFENKLEFDIGFKYDNVTQMLITCNYAKTNMPDSVIYEKCNTPALNCTKRNPKYNNLCSTDEKYDVNKYKTLVENPTQYDNVGCLNKYYYSNL